MNPNTPFNERFAKISEKLSSIQLHHDTSKAHRIDVVCGRVSGVEERIQDIVKHKKYQIYSKYFINQIFIVDQRYHNQQLLINLERVTKKRFQQLKNKNTYQIILINRYIILVIILRFNNTITSYNRKLHSLKDEIVRLQKQIEEENNAFETQFEQKVREIAAFESRITTKLEQEISIRKDGNLKLQGYLDEKIVYLKSDVQTESKIRQEQIENITTSLENDLPKLYDLVKTEGQDREDSDNGTLRRAGDEIKRLNEGLGNQKKLREESESAIFEMLKDLVSRVKSEIEEEKKLREESQENLLGLLEDACNKIYRAAKD